MDKRILKTRKSICDALLKLIETKSSNKITVTEIASLAQIERKTFYLHYNSIDDVYKDIEKSISKELEEEANKYINKSEHKIEDIFKNLNLVINNNFNFFKSVCKNDSYYFLVRSFETLLSKIILKIAIENYNIKSKNIK